MLVQRTLTAATLLATLACSHSTAKTDTTAPAAVEAAAGPGKTTPDITPGDLRTRLYAFADDSMQGRKAGTPGNVKGTDYLAGQAKRIGLEPAGENGSWFQAIPMVVRVLDSTSSVSVGSTILRPWNDIVPRDQGTGTRSINGVQAVYGGVWSDKNDVMISRDMAAGKLVVITVVAQTSGIPAGLVNRAATTARFAKAAGIAVATLDAVGPTDRVGLEDGGARLASGVKAGPETPAFFYVTTAGATALLGKAPAGLEPGAEGQTVHGKISFADREPAAPARNVVAILRGSDPALRGQMVAIGAHSDHEGIFPLALDHDSIRAFNKVMRPEGANNSPGTPTEPEPSSSAPFMIESGRGL